MALYISAPLCVLFLWGKAGPSDGQNHSFSNSTLFSPLNDQCGIADLLYFGRQVSSRDLIGDYEADDAKAHA